MDYDPEHYEWAGRNLATFSREELIIIIIELIRARRATAQRYDRELRVLGGDRVN